MHRFLLGLSAVTLIVVACGSDDDKKVSPGAEAGAAGEAGAKPVAAGGSSVNAAGEGGEPSVPAAGTGGDAAGGTGSGTAGEPAGGAPAAGASAGGAPAGSSAGGAAGTDGVAGAGGEGPAPVSAFCDPGEYYVGEGGCLVCEEAPQTIEVSCVQLSENTRLVSDGGPLWIDLYPPAPLREPIAHQLAVSFRVGDSLTEVSYPGLYSYDNGYWTIDISEAASSASEEVQVLPFTVRTACGDTFELLDEVIFVQAEPNSDTYDLICPNQG